MTSCKAALPRISKNNHKSEEKKTSKNKNLLRLAMKNSIKNQGREKVGFARNMVIRLKRLSASPSQWYHRCQTFQTMPSKLSIMSDSQGLSIMPTIIDDQLITNPQDFQNSIGFGPNKSKNKKIKYSSYNMILLKLAIKNSIKKEGAEKVMFARKMVVRPKSLSPNQWNRLHRTFQTMPSRLSIKSDSLDLSVSQ